MTPLDENGGRAGPILYMRRLAEGRLELAALVLRPEGEAPGAFVAEGAEIEPRALATIGGVTAHRYDFALTADAAAGYTHDGTAYPVRTAVSGDLRIAFVSCNGEEHGDLARDPAERDAMWLRLGERHDEAPFSLLLHGGDQIYADEVTLAHPATRDWPGGARQTLSPDQLGEVAGTLRRAYWARYIAAMARPAFAHLAARVPSLAIWDDHDICDGWGSLLRGQERRPLGRTLFTAARDAYLLFQHGTVPGGLPPGSLDLSGANLGWRVDLPGVSLIAPDLRSERTRRRIMSPAGRAALRASLARGVEDRVILISSVPLLGPRLSLVERAMRLTPWMEKYEDDLRDQWQSYAHRAEWRRMLRQLAALQADGHAVTVLSGEIHLATRGTMETAAGPLHQLVASGVAHRAPPRLYADVLGTLARLGEAPVPEHPIRLHPLPGRRRIYVAERNYLVLERKAGRWRAAWDLEDGGLTPELPL
ncbi:alkaline phosphatase family protein [Rhodosalinus halophilus]|uniref:Alkaline phosphatase family protein n=1 Tax=Rhodosalinus halophilus TaxID=2259333 RepID=A0A365UA91_9RHOB|nr:alkaline phosphatase D family protein [Rhodosalinus halophilus]RBI85889.1 alkaline phosphatase family protein [Rhodosalinus halophilus]